MSKELNEIAQIIAGLSRKEIKLFLQQMLTPNEVHDLDLRWRVFRSLAEGKPQRQIGKELGISLCKITRGSRELKKPESLIKKILKEKKYE